MTKGGLLMETKTVVLSVFFLIISSSLWAATNGLMQSADNTAPGNVTINAAEATAAAPVSATSGTPSTHIYLNALGIEIAMSGRIIPGISYSRYFSPYFFVTLFGDAVVDHDGVESLLAINGFRMFNDFIYAGLGFGTIFDKGKSVLIGLANPAAGLMVRITPAITFYAEATAWFFKIRTNSNVVTFPDSNVVTLLDSNPLIFKAGIKYYFSWLDPIPDIGDMIR